MSAATECPKCKTLEEQIFRLTMERQLLIERIAAERERANALFVSYPPQEAVARENTLAPIDGRPLRYRLVDSLNELAHRLPGYWLARRAALRLTADANG